jgi:thymidylate synthase
MSNVQTIQDSFVELYTKKQFVTDKTGVKTIELVGASFVCDKPAIFGAPNFDYIKRELKWYESESLNVNDLEPTPQIWQAISDKDGNINSNYGYLIYNKKNGEQFIKVRDELTKNPNSRRAVMIYTRPTIHDEYNLNGMSDFICTNAVQYLIRDKKLHAIVQMRSNDVVFGYRNDFAWQQYVLGFLADELNVEYGDITWQVGSLHVYERHFSFIEDEIQKRKDKKETMKLADMAMGNYYGAVADFYD